MKFNSKRNVSKTSVEKRDAWGRINNSYSSGYSNTLKFLNIINAFVLPFMGFGILGLFFSDSTDQLSLLLATIGYVTTSFNLWVSLLSMHNNAYILTTKSIAEEADIASLIIDGKNAKEASEWIVQN